MYWIIRSVLWFLTENNNLGQQYGHNPARNKIALPREELSVDFIGTRKVDVPGTLTLVIKEITEIDI